MKWVIEMFGHDSMCLAWSQQGFYKSGFVVTSVCLVFQSGRCRTLYALSERCEDGCYGWFVCYHYDIHTPPPYSYTIYCGTLEYCTVCGTNSLVAGPGLGMV